MPQEDPSKTEKATSKRRRQHRRDGNVPKSNEVTKALVLLSAILALRFMMGYYYEEFVQIYRWAMTDALSININPGSAYRLFIWGIKEMTILVLPFLLVLVFISYMSQRLQVGKLWTTKPMKPNFGKLFNIMAGLKRLMISPRAAINFGKSILQATAVSIAPYIVIKQEMNNLLPLFHTNAQAILGYILGVGYKMVCYALVPMMLIAVAELWYNRWNYEEKIKMSKDEVKDERRQAEGDPQIKARQKRKMMEMMTKWMFEDVPKADVVITNPTHYAVALQYDVMVAPAPRVLAKGVNRVAERIKDIARENNIPIEQNVPLARALYKQVEIGESIPEELFQAVAAVLARLDKFRKRR